MDNFDGTAYRIIQNFEIELQNKKIITFFSFVATRGSLKSVAYIILIAAIEGGDKMLQAMIHLMHRYGPIRVEHFIDVKGKVGEVKVK